jgi:hypothetical protein
MTKLTLQLTRVYDKNNEHYQLLDGFAFRMELKTKDGSGTPVTMNTATETTPHTSKGNGKHGD